MRRTVSAATLCLLVLLAGAAPPASAALPHTVAAGETLWSIAAANNLTTRSVAIYNGLAEDAHVRLGATIDVPTEAEAAAAMEGTGMLEREMDSVSGSGSAYVVRWGDTLSGIAAGAGTSTARLAELNGLDVARPLLQGTVVRLPGESPAETSADESAGSTSGSSDPGPFATPGRVNFEEIAQIAEAHGVPPSLAAAVAWQESGFNNGLVSSADARGVMQIIPSTWDFIQHALANHPLDPASARENVHAGVMLISYLLRATGGDPARAAAAYYQGLESMETRGVLPETQRYVDNVLALRSRFGGP